MIIISIAYALVLACVLIAVNRFPAGPFLLANAYGLFMTLPCALAYYYMFQNRGTIDYGNYDLDSTIYILIFCFQAGSFLLALLLYRAGYKSGMRHPTRQLLNIDNRSAAYRFTTLLMVGLAVVTLLFVHKAFGFELLLEPRRLYELSRADFGSHFFVLGLALRLGALLVLMSGMRRKKIVFLCLLAFSLFTGAKVNTYIILMFAAMYYVVFHRGGKIRMALLLKLGLVALPLVYLLISLTFQGSEINIFELLVAYVNEPWNNFTLLTQTFDKHFPSLFGGWLTLENNVISRIPRPLFPDKPYLFGGFRLADEYFPETVALGIGAPSFGAEGIVYADWGVAGLFVLAALKGLISWLLGKVTCILTRYQVIQAQGNFLYFGLLLILADLYFLTLPPANNLFDNVLILTVLAAFFGIKKIRIARRRRLLLRSA